MLSAGCGARPTARRHAIVFSGATMGTTFSVRIAGGPPAGFAPGFELTARTAVLAAFDHVVQRMSTFEAASELRRFNAHAATTPFALSSETLAVLQRAQQVAADSGGAFDATVAPLVGAWGFGAGASAREARPSASALAALAEGVGWRQLVVDTEHGQARKQAPALQLDLSGIAKGYAVDRAAQALQALGVERYMVEAGGEVRTRGLNAEGRPWQIAIEKPDAWPQQVQRIVPLQGLAMATSGDYRNFYQLGGQRISHEIDPATRAPAAHALASVSVVHEECMSADAWSTALFVLGPQRGLALARERGLAAHFIVRDGDVLREVTTPAFDAVLAASARQRTT
ncbi:MAG: FAD:protein FMN transferase [Rubrivivax sp.]|nr:FAD:protein FMN transferase [Rubrivivax sp.]